MRLRRAARGVASTSRRLRAALTVAVALLACGTRPGAAPRAFDPDAPTWRGGCFLSGPPGKMVNATAAPTVIAFGRACADPPGPGGLVYLDRYDPVSGDGDVTVLSSAPGAAPVVVARSGGGGSVDVGSTGARIDPAASRLLTLANVSFITGDLIEAPLPGATPTRTLGSRVRVGNYDFTAGEGIVYVGNYDATAREGDLEYVGRDGPPLLLAPGISRFDFLMYRLSPDAARVAYLLSWKEESGGQLFVRPLPPEAGPAIPVATGVYRMAWTQDGHLVFRTVADDGVTYVLWTWAGDGSPVRLADGVQSASVVGNALVFTTGWNVLEQRASLHLVEVAGGPDLLSGTGPASLSFSAALPAGTPGALAYFLVPPVPVASEGELHVARISAAGELRVDSAVSISPGVGISPRAGFVSYAVGFAAPQAPASANPQPGIARELRVASVETGGSFLLARDASTFVAWDPAERFVAAVGAFEPSPNRGELVVRRTADGTVLHSLPGVGNGRFGFASDGSLLWAIQDWDDAMRRGRLVIATLSDAAVSPPATVASDVAWVAEARGGRVLYGVGGGPRDGLWLGGAP